LPVKEWSGTSLPTISFGQGYSLTAIQATSIFSTIANDGVRVSPSIIKGTISPTGAFTAFKKSEPVRAVSDETARKMRLIMESVVGPSGTAATATIPGYRAAGKTGTAWRHDQTCGCYKGYTASFIGFAPADDPEYVVNVTIQAPKGVYYGGVLGGPVFKEVMSYILQAKNIPPPPKPEEKYALTYKDYIRKISAQSESRNTETNNGKTRQENGYERGKKEDLQQQDPEKKKSEKVDARG
jgi:cell division protein FtsI (penicillin-binding protein 3)